MNRVDIPEILELVGISATDIAITHWHTTIGHLGIATVREAIEIHQRANTFLPTAREILDIAADIHERDNPTLQPARRHAVMTAYTLTGSLNHACPRCGAKPGDTCTAVTGLEAHAPCVARLTRKTVAA
ncbi:hypothetical protein ACFPPE_06935 [Agromyces tardus]|uniref:zinc finger domain-containing protein n=1 Tax=Agromyces tardus TaxID=2583849 RepID=UPI0036204207